MPSTLRASLQHYNQQHPPPATATTTLLPATSPEIQQRIDEAESVLQKQRQQRPITPTFNNSPADNTPTVQPPFTLHYDDSHPLTKLLLKHQSLLQLQSTLQQRKSLYNTKEHEFSQRESTLKQKDLELQEALVIFNKFLVENESKIAHAQYRISEERKKISKWQREYQLRQVLHQKLQAKNHELQLQCHRYEPYALYLQHVYDEHSSHYDEISSIVSRYHTLSQTNDDLIRKQTTLLEEYEALRTKFVMLCKDSYTQQLSLNNDIVSYSSCYDLLLHQRLTIEESLLSNEELTQEKQRQVTQICMAIDNLYTRCKKTVTAMMNSKNNQKKSNNAKVDDGSDGMLNAGMSGGIAEDAVGVIDKLNQVATYLEDFATIAESVGGEDRAAKAGVHQQQQQAVPTHQSAADEYRAERVA